MNWATAVALALVDTATRQKRQAAVLHFNTHVIQEVEFAYRERSPEKIISVATVQGNGGTDYAPALTRAMEMIGSIGYQKADIIMITDGECRMTENILDIFLSEKERLGFRCWSVLVGYGASSELDKWSDQVWPVSQLTDEVAGGIFEAAY